MYDLLILGGGPAGYLAAERAAQSGLKAAVFEKSNIGGVCLNEGCIPSKALLYSAKIYHNAAHGEKYGVKVENAFLDHKYVISRKKKVVEMLTGGIRAKLKKLGANLISAEGIIKGRSLEGFVIAAGGKEYVGKFLLIATGSVSVIPPIEGLKESLNTGFALTNSEILELKQVPGELAIIGGGVIGLEMANYYCAAGSKVTVIEMLDHIGGNVDRDISKSLQLSLEKIGVKFLLSSKVTKISGRQVTFEKNGKEQAIKADKVLLSIGRKPFTEGIGLENIGVYTERGRIITDEMCRTNVAGAYAAGDVNGVSMLAHTAYREAEVAVNNILGKKDYVDYDAIPAVIYTNPEVASVGLTEEAARARGISVKAAKLSMNYSGRYAAENEGGDGFIKLVADAEGGALLGCHMVGNYSSEFIVAASMMVQMRMRIADIKKIVFPHPTVSEIIREAIFELQ
jgi:dihydrolipoamide dehydrogenase